MSLSDHELELLDRYLDGDLSEAELVGLEARLKSDVTMSSELSRLREWRAVRVEAFASLEPGELESQRLQWYVRGALQQHRQAARPVLGRATVWMRGLTRVAAVLVLGFAVGYIYRGGVAGPGAVTEATSGATVAGSPARRGLDLTADGPPLLVPDSRHIAGIGAGSITPVAVPLGQPPAFEVTLTDASGKLITRQRFATLAEAQQFANDFHRLRQKQLQLRSGGVRLIGDDF
ncbi:MAG: hypothetical protein NZ561_02710 [Phycisphaerae bacterium]|nr:hypothetical protein [Phycisphaerae bacterium]MDW8261284.1 hypothetical protein [Phycisphaerales bacterium]